METYEAIMTRRSVPKAEGPAPDRATIQRLLDAAVRAPNHHLTQPWRFCVLTGSALDQLADAWERGLEQEGKDPSGIRDKVQRAPAIICVIEHPHRDNPKVDEIEEHHAVGAAIQNILLAAHDMGLGAMHRTGPAAKLPEVERFLEVVEGEFIAGFIYIGQVPEGDSERPMTRRKPATEITQWKGWE